MNPHPICTSLRIGLISLDFYRINNPLAFLVLVSGAQSTQLKRFT